MPNLKNHLILFYFLSLCFSSKASNANFRYENHCLNNLIYFEDLSNTESTIVSWFWDFGDESISMDQNTIHAYSESGHYTVELSIKTESGRSYNSIQKINILTPPFAFFNPNEMCNNTVVFNENSFTRASEVRLWMWDFGDGNYSLEKNPTHKFSEDILQKVGLKIIDQNGCGDSISQTINLKKLPKTGFNIQNINFKNTALIKIESSNQIDHISYLINDELINSKNTHIDVPQSKSVCIKQKVVDKTGCSDSIQRIVYAGSDYYLSIPPTFVINTNKDVNSFGVSSSNVKITDFEIRDTLGNIFFKKKSNTSKWNGKKEENGTLAAKGIYYYTIRFQTSSNNSALQKGNFLLLYKD